MRLLYSLLAVMWPQTTADVVLAVMLGVTLLCSCGYVVIRTLRASSVARISARLQNSFDFDEEGTPDAAAALRQFEGQFDRDSEDAVV